MAAADEPNGNEVKSEEIQEEEQETGSHVVYLQVLVWLQVSSLKTAMFNWEETLNHQGGHVRPDPVTR